MVLAGKIRRLLGISLRSVMILTVERPPKAASQLMYFMKPMIPRV